MNNIKIKCKDKKDVLVPTEVSLAFGVAAWYEQLCFEQGVSELGGVFWMKWGQSVARLDSSIRKGHIVTVGYASSFRLQPFKATDGTVGTAECWVR